jgi:hypothetical protein
MENSYREDLFRWQYVFLSRDAGWLGKIVEIQGTEWVLIQPILWGSLITMGTEKAHLSKADIQSGIVRSAASLILPDGYKVNVTIYSPEWTSLFDESFIQGDLSDRISNS